MEKSPFGENRTGQNLVKSILLLVFREIWRRIFLRSWITIGINCTFRLGTIHNESASHKGLIMKYFYRTLSLINPGHFYKTITLRAMRISVINDFNFTHRTYSFKKIFEVVFGRIIGEVANVKTLPFDLGAIWSRPLFLAGPGSLTS